jgi:inner membrane protein
MEPVTHFLTGACMGRAGLNRKTAYATLAGALAAEAADIDILWHWAGPVENLKHHRGITHTFLAAPLVAAAVVGVIFLFEYWKRERQKDLAAPRTLSTKQKPHWGWLYATALMATLSHLLLDWTNNYGVRPFFPFNPRWYAGSFVFIAEPVLWALLGAAFVMPWILGLADQEIGVRRKPFRGRGWAIFALAGMVALWGWRWTERTRAQALVEQTQLGSEPARRVALEPYPFNPWRWHAIEETASAYQTAEVNARTGAVESDPGHDLVYKPADTPSVEAAKRTGLGRVYLDWGQWAVVRDLGPVPAPGMEPPQLLPGRKWTTVQFTDLRFGYSLMARPEVRERTPLTGWVYVVDGREEAGEAMGGREQRY